MEEILSLILYFLFEVFFNLLCIFGEVPFYRGESEDSKTKLRCMWSLLFGLLLGWLSLLCFPKTLVTVEYLRIANLLISPILAGLVSKKIAEFVQRKKDNVWPERHFWYAFWLCFGCVVVRFIGAQH